MDDDTLTITCFDEAAGTALELAELFDRAHASAVLDRDGKLVDLMIYTDDEATIASSLVWAGGVMVAHPEAAAVVLFSVGEDDVGSVHEHETQLFHQAKAGFAQRGVELLDWITGDDEQFRSLAITCGIEANWPAA
jgi:hypothetical protein